MKYFYTCQIWTKQKIYDAKIIKERINKAQNTIIYFLSASLSWIIIYIYIWTTSYKLYDIVHLFMKKGRYQYYIGVTDIQNSICFKYKKDL